MEKQTIATQTIQFYNTKNKYTQTNTIENSEEEIIKDTETTDKTVIPNNKFYQPNTFNWYREAKTTQTKIIKNNKTTQTPTTKNWNKRKINKRKCEEEYNVINKVKRVKYVATNREDMEIESENIEKWLKIVARK